MQALCEHRAVAARLYELVLKVPYQPQTAIALVDQVRALDFIDCGASTGVTQVGQFVGNGNDVNLVLRDPRLDTATRSISVTWLGEAYLEG
jgi:hypothetical protein